MPEYLYISDNFSVSRPIYINRYARESGKPRRAELPMMGAALCGGALLICHPQNIPQVAGSKAFTAVLSAGCFGFARCGETTLRLTPNETLHLTPNETPCLTSNETPCLITHETPCLTTHETPCLIIHETPCLITHETPCLITRETPCLIRRETPCLIRHETPCLIRRETRVSQSMRPVPHCMSLRE